MRFPARGALRLCLLALFIAGVASLATDSGWADEQIPSQAKPKAPMEKAQAEKTAPDATLPEAWVKSLNWRSIGPANMGGRITAISVFEPDPCIYWVATASGGLLKTINNGVTFEHQFDREATVSIGDICVAPSNPNIVWVGTGEA